MYNQEDKTGLWVGIGIAVLVLITILSVGISASNSAVRYEKNIPRQISDLNVLENRKVTLFNNMVDTIKASTSREEEILTKITELRSSGKSDSSAISITAEAYPELKSIQSYNTFMTEMAITENGIATQRQAINSTITDYETLFSVFPSSLFLSGREMKNFPLFNVEVDSDGWEANWNN